MNLFKDTYIKNNYCFFWDSIFSQWYICEFKEEDKTFYSAEQYMMYHKALVFNDLEIADKILKEVNPRIIKAYGRQIKNFTDEIWDKHKIDIVTKGNLLKFSQNKNLKETLLKYPDMKYVETSPEDPIWGIGMYYTDSRCLDETQWQGLNLLGKCLDAARDTLKENIENI